MNHLPATVTLAQMTGAIDLDPILRNCPACGEAQLRIEVRVEMYPISEIARTYQITEDDVHAIAKVDAFGRVESAVPHITCMSCGGDWDASKEPPQ